MQVWRCVLLLSVSLCLWVPMLTEARLPNVALLHMGSKAAVGKDTTAMEEGADGTLATSENKRGILSLRPIVKKCLSWIITDKDVLSLFATILSGTIWIYLLMTVVGTLGIDTKPLVSLVTVSGFTLGWAAKDILTSTIAAAYMISMRAFKRDMVISIGEHKGRVKSFDTNFVKLITMDNRLVLIPMASVYGKAVVIHAGSHDS